METMNIYALKGHKVRCSTFNAGYDSDNVTAKEYLELDKEYTIEYTNVDNWCTSVYLQEIPNVSFNSCFFIDVTKQSLWDSKQHPDAKRYL